jgi:hypothetical protein
MTIDELRAKIISDLGHKSWTGKPKAYVDLDAQAQVNVTWEMMNYIRTHPTEFEAATVERAKAFIEQSLKTGGNTPLADTSFGASVSEFGSALADEAVKKINLGGNILKNAIYIAVVVGVISYFSPRIAAAIRPKK